MRWLTKLHTQAQKRQCGRRTLKYKNEISEIFLDGVSDMLMKMGETGPENQKR